MGTALNVECQGNLSACDCGHARHRFVSPGLMYSPQTTKFCSPPCHTSEKCVPSSVTERQEKERYANQNSKFSESKFKRTSVLFICWPEQWTNCILLFLSHTYDRYKSVKSSIIQLCFRSAGTFCYHCTTLLLMSRTQPIATGLLLSLHAGHIFYKTHFIRLKPNGYFIYHWLLHSQIHRSSNRVHLCSVSFSE